MFHTFAFPQFQTFGGGMPRIPNPSAKSPLSPRLASAGSLGSPAVGSLEASPGSTLDNRGVSPIGARPWTGPGDHHELPQPVQHQDVSAAKLPPRPPSAQSVSPRPSSRCNHGLNAIGVILRVVQEYLNRFSADSGYFLFRNLEF